MEQWNLVITIGLGQHNMHPNNETVQLRHPLQRHRTSYGNNESRNNDVSLYSTKHALVRKRNEC